MNQGARPTDGIGTELSFLWRLLAPYRGVLALTIALLLGESLILLTMPWIAGQVAAALLNSTVPTQLLLAWLGLLSTHTLLTVGNGLLMGRTSAWVVADLGGRVFDHLQSLPVRWHQERKVGSSRVDLQACKLEYSIVSPK